MNAATTYTLLILGLVLFFGLFILLLIRRWRGAVGLAVYAAFIASAFLLDWD